MKKVVGIRFKPAGKIYDFDCGAYVLELNDPVIVETEQGLGFGTVAVPPAPWENNSRKKPLKKVFRMASEKVFVTLRKILFARHAKNFFQRFFP